MQVLAVGIGGAGSRIVETLDNFEKRKRGTRTFFGLAVNTDPEELKSLTLISDQQKLFFPRIIVGPDGPRERGPEPHAVAETLLNNDKGDTDAILIICGLGGSSSQYICPLIETLRSSVIEPIFGVFTLPDPNKEPEKRINAIVDLKEITGRLDGIFLFENDLIIPSPDNIKIKNSQKGEIQIPFLKNQEPDIYEKKNQEWNIPNMEIARRISVILSAGEPIYKGGKKPGEVVVDAGDVINTIKKTGLISLCYAREQLKSLKSGVRDNYTNDETRASRIMNLAHDALLLSPSCRFNPEDAKKALILVAGPSQELSMKGYMATRDWLNRLMPEGEIRGGDYPIQHSQFVAVVIIAAGFPFQDTAPGQ